MEFGRRCTRRAYRTRAEIHVPAGLVAFATALSGFLLATIIYGWRLVDPKEVRQIFRPVYHLLWSKWWFDELYNYDLRAARA